MTDLQLTFDASERIQHNVNEEFRDRKNGVAKLASIEMLEVSIYYSNVFIVKFITYFTQFSLHNLSWNIDNLKLMDVYLFIFFNAGDCKCAWSLWEAKEIVSATIIWSDAA